MSASAIWKSSANIQFQVGSGQMVLSDRATFVDIYKGPIANCAAGLLTRGTYGTVARDGWVVCESTLETERGGIGKLTIRWEAGGPNADLDLLPNDDFDITVMELYPKIERNPYFADITANTVELAHRAAFASTSDIRNVAWGDLNGISNSTQRTLGLALYDKWTLGEETYYQAGLQYTSITHSYGVPSTLSLGGFIDTPAGPMAGLLPSGFDWLRKADVIKPKGVNGSCFEIQSTWLGGPNGHWDADLYPSP